MYPTLRPGDKALVQKCEAGDCSRGDIVGFRQEKQLVCHRIYKIEYQAGNLVFHTKGDNNPKPDKPFRTENLLGIVRSFERNGKTFSLSGKSNSFSKFLYLKFPNAALLYNRMHYVLSKAFISVSSLRTNFPMVIQHSEKLFWLNAVISVLQGILPFVTLVLIKFLIDVLTIS